MELKGCVNDIIYQNDANGYTICDFELEDETLITACGYLPFINSGDILKLIGSFINHPEYGEQFKIQTFEKCMPETIREIERYLAGGIIKGVGPATAKKIVDKFKENTIEVLKSKPEELSKVSGITFSRAEDIVNEFNEKWDLWKIVGFLEKFGISTSNCQKVYEKLGKDAITKITENPYILFDITYGVDFVKIDKMALEIGMDINSMERVESAIKYALSLISLNGHTCALKENLITYVTQLLKIEKEIVEDGLINLKAKKIIFEEEKENGIYVFLSYAYEAEKNISQKLIKLLCSKNLKKVKEIDLEIHKAEEEMDIFLSDEQKEAIKLVNDNNVCIITGGPGTRKNNNNKSNY